MGRSVGLAGFLSLAGQEVAYSVVHNRRDDDTLAAGQLRLLRFDPGRFFQDKVGGKMAGSAKLAVGVRL